MQEPYVQCSIKSIHRVSLTSLSNSNVSFLHRDNMRFLISCRVHLRPFGKPCLLEKSLIQNDYLKLVCQAISLHNIPIKLLFHVRAILFIPRDILRLMPKLFTKKQTDWERFQTEILKYGISLLVPPTADLFNKVVCLIICPLGCNILLIRSMN